MLHPGPSPSAPVALAAEHFPRKDILLDRALGAMLGGAVGDAHRLSNGNQWHAITSMVISTLQSAVQGSDISTQEERRELVTRWIAW